MSAFKILNLRNASPHIILMLLSLSLGLSSFIFFNIRAPLIFELAFVFSYFIFGDFVYSVYNIKKSEKYIFLLISFLLFVLSVIFNILCFNCSYYFLSAGISVIYVLLGLFLCKKLRKAKKSAFWKITPQLLLFSACFFYSIFCIFKH